jgi:uncharacterized protein (TIGR03435 family)
MMDAARWRRIFFRAPMLVMASALFGALLLHGQAESSSSKPDSSQNSDVSADVPKYDVATIKPSTASEPRMMFGVTPDGVRMENIPIQMILREAFNVEDDRIIGAPGWVKTKRYDIQAKVAPEDGPKLEKLKMDQRRSMMLPVLEERLNLNYHHETRELPLYSLVVAKGGPKLKVSDIPAPGPDGKIPDGGPGKPGDLGKGGPGPRMGIRMGRGDVEANGAPIQLLTRILSQQLGRSVVDKTGLTGNYDFKLNWTGAML